MIKNGLIDVSNIDGVPVRIDLIPKSNKTSRPQYKMTPRLICIHNTGNKAKGANAKMHTQYVDNTTNYVSWHFTVDDKEIFQELPINESAWHSGDGSKGKGNRTAIAIEICENEGIDWEKAKLNAVKLIHFLMKYVKTLNNAPIKTHKYFSGKYCPHRILDEGLGKFLATVDNYKGVLTPPIKKPRIIVPHWAEPYYKTLTEKYKLDLTAKRFDDKMSRGEVMAILVKLLEAGKL